MTSLRCPYRNVLRELERENRELKMKVEFLSKAAATRRAPTRRKNVSEPLRVWVLQITCFGVPRRVAWHQVASCPDEKEAACGTTSGPTMDAVEVVTTFATVFQGRASGSSSVGRARERSRVSTGD